MGRTSLCLVAVLAGVHTIDVTQNNLLEIIPELSSEWSLTLEVNPSETVGQLEAPARWGIIFQMTTSYPDPDDSSPGDRIPAIFFEPESTRLHICNSNIGSTCFSPDPNITPDLPLNEWTAIEISQTLIDGIYMYVIKIADTEVYSTQNTNAQDYPFANVRVYASNPWDTAAAAQIRRLDIQPKETTYVVGNDGSNCWEKCSGGGSCEWCGQGGYCCSAHPDNVHLNGDCTSSHLEPLTDYWHQSGKAGHICSVPAAELPCEILNLDCEETQFAIVVNEECRASRYPFVNWQHSFVDGDITTTEFAAIQPCVVIDDGTHFAYRVPYLDCNIQAPAPSDADENGIKWYNYQLYLNFDTTIDSLGTGSIQQLGQTLVECKIPANLQEDVENPIEFSDYKMIDNQEDNVELWNNLKLDVHKGGYGPGQGEGTVRYELTPLADGDQIGLGENVQLKISGDAVDAYNIAIDNCWATTTLEPREANEVNFPTADYTPQTTVFLNNQCPVYGWVYSKAARDPTTIDKNIEIELRQFAFLENDNEFYYHCELLICLPGEDCVPDNLDCPEWSGFGPSTSRRKRSILSSKRIKRQSLDEEYSHNFHVDLSRCAQTENVGHGEAIICVKERSSAQYLSISGFMTFVILFSVY